MILKMGVPGRMYFRQITFYYENARGGGGLPFLFHPDHQVSPLNQTEN